MSDRDETRADEALGRAASILRAVQDRGDPGTANSIALAQAWATVALAASNMMPEPEDVLAHANAEAVRMLQEVAAILEPASREGRRHPAIHAALEVLRGR